MAKYRVTVEYHIKEKIEVEAVDANEAEAKALEEGVDFCNAELYDVKVKLLNQ